MDQDLKNVMTDIETLDTEQSAVIISIGAVRFDEDQIGETFYRVIDVYSNLAAGRTIGERTVAWWQDQSEEAREVLKGAGAVSLTTALTEFNAFVGSGTAVLGNGALFDNAILLSACKSVNIKPAWKFYDDECYRTLKKRFSYIPKSTPLIPHHALEDAMAQALHCQKILREITRAQLSYEGSAKQMAYPCAIQS